ncbi:hypothetical protein L7F22_015299 [Adiantum nelumboides]|nr:hypothetical protein [Adiantum nelumboides]
MKGIATCDFIALKLCLLMFASLSHALSQDGQALLEFSKSLQGPNWPPPTWNASLPSPCSAWDGVKCDASGRVTALHLGARNLSGSISNAISGLSELVTLNLSLNRFHDANIPASLAACQSLQILLLNSNKFIGSIPPELGRLSSLQVLDFSANLLSGTIPPELANLQNLQTLNLFSNSLNGSIPHELGSLKSLRQLALFSNKLSGSIPPSLGNLTRLRVLRIGNNALSGKIPPELGGCESLQVLGLTQSMLEGSIPPEFGKLRSLTSLALWKNELTGTIPPELGNLSNLTSLTLYKNYDLTGDIPPEIGKLQKLQILYMYRSNLTGHIPQELGNCTSLVELDLSMNQLTGVIPAELGNLRNLRLLQLFQNNLTGSIPQEFGKLVTMYLIDLSINQLSGSIPLNFQSLTNLSQLMVADNKLTGVIPPLLGYYSHNFTVLDVTDNALSGHIPDKLCKNGKLARLSLGVNNLEGTIPDGVKNCLSLSGLDLHQNLLSGEIPSELSLLSHLAYLDVSHNKFTGGVPAAFGSLSNLVYLVISNNNLSGQLPGDLGKLTKLGLFQAAKNRINGTIPVELGNCTSLQRLNLSSNMLSGEIPNLSNLSMLAYLDLSNNQLTGSIPPEIGDLDNLLALQLGSNDLSGEIPPELGKLTRLNIALSLRGNNLTGGIPPELGELPLLNYLYLDHNQLSGEIPASFSNSTSLLVFNVSYNHLTGPIPEIFAHMNSDNFLNNMGLCGASLPNACPVQQLVEDNTPDSTRSVALVQTIVGTVVGVLGLSFIVIVSAAFCMCRRPPSRGGFHGLNELEKGRSDSESSYSFFTAVAPGFTFQDILEATANFSPECEIGRGACGTVYKAKLPSGKLIAVKRVASQREGSPMENSFNAEVTTLGKIRHSNIVKLYGFCYHQEANLLLYEYMPKGSVGEHLHHRKIGGDMQTVSCGLDWDTRYWIALGSAEGLAYLHHDCKPHIIHRDIKCNNILLDNDMKAHVGDFGLAKIMDVPYSMSMSAIAGSYGYIAPEYAYSMKITSKCDVYSYGVVLLELLTGLLPVQSMELGGDLVTWVRTSIALKKELKEIFDSRLSLENSFVLQEMVVVLKVALLCTSVLPTDRPTMREVVCMLSGARREQDARERIENRLHTSSGQDEDSLV